jgi:hypothetical protein
MRHLHYLLGKSPRNPLSGWVQSVSKVYGFRIGQESIADFPDFKIMSESKNGNNCVLFYSVVSIICVASDVWDYRYKLMLKRFGLYCNNHLDVEAKCKGIMYQLFGCENSRNVLGLVYIHIENKVLMKKCKHKAA